MGSSDVIEAFAVATNFANARPVFVHVEKVFGYKMHRDV
jgi:hypothetical protein